MMSIEASMRVSEGGGDAIELDTSEVEIDATEFDIALHTDDTATGDNDTGGSGAVEPTDSADPSACNGHINTGSDIATLTEIGASGATTRAAATTVASAVFLQVGGRGGEESEYYDGDVHDEDTFAQ
jgi:hypothetical protein